ncbi:hypothetical protein TNCV_3724901 [Trichonephila clavipes]|nr:hypothetical protein TNCV_3724901 [Trichonephila clavipes]
MESPLKVEDFDVSCYSNYRNGPKLEIPNSSLTVSGELGKPMLLLISEELCRDEVQCGDDKAGNKLVINRSTFGRAHFVERNLLGREANSSFSYF